MSHPRIAARLYTQPWCIEPATWHTLAAQFEAHVAAPRAQVEVASTDDADDSPLYQVQNGVAYLCFAGVIAKHLSLMETMCGGADLATLEEACAQITTDPSVRRVVLELRSPGGVASGLTEASAAIRSVADSGRHVTAFADDLCCSAAYWLASACDRIAATPSARLGSISTLWAGVDDSDQWAAEGLKRVLLVTGKYKAIGISGLPMTEDHLAELARHVAEIDSEFKGYVRDRRGLDDDDLQGQTWRAASAPRGLVDLIVPSLAELLAYEMQAAAARW